MNCKSFLKLCLVPQRLCSVIPARHLVLSYNTPHQGDDDQPPLLMTHGLLGNKNNFNTVAKMLGKKLPNLTIISCDVRNHGDSPHSDEMNYDVMACDMIDLMDSLNVPKCILLGHSLGGRIAMLTALRNPERVHKLIVVDVAPGRRGVDRGMSKGPLKYVEAMMGVTWDAGMKRSQIRKAAGQQLMQAIPSKTIRNFALTNLIEKEDGSFGWRVNLSAISSSAKQLSYLPDVGSLQYHGKTLFLGGALSEYIVDEDQPTIAKMFPNSVIQYIPSCGHWVHADKPKKFVSSVVEFLKQP